MKMIWNLPIVAVIVFCFYACNATTGKAKATKEETSLTGAQSAAQNSKSQDIVKIAAGSKVHTALVASVKRAELVVAE